MKKKIVSVLLVAAMAVSMFTGCGSKNDSKKSDSKSGEKTLEVWLLRCRKGPILIKQLQNLKIFQNN